MSIMKPIIALSLLLALSSYLSASKIPRITSDELVKKSELIIIGTVLEVVPHQEVLDKVKVRINSFIKGENKSTHIIVTLQVRGGLKDWDPTLKPGDMGVFFLRKSGDSYRAAHGGSISVFEKSYLDSKKKAEQDGARQPTTAPDSKSEGNKKPKPEAEGRSQ